MSSYSGSAIRTTHLTGIATDIGLITGRHIMSFLRNHCFRRCPVDHWSLADAEAGDGRKLVLLVLLLLSFLTGVAAGSTLASAINELSILVPAIISFVAGCGYMLWQHQRETLLKEIDHESAPTSPTAEPLKREQDACDDALPTPTIGELPGMPENASMTSEPTPN
mmetsp:Transcript_32578/g.57772  ORF Transcript_32578/g.57772 Transcript_32578/m.57772 type:complete len:166 (+) Transcript_32578:2-499(+)